MASRFEYKIRLSFAVSPSAVTDLNRGHSDKHRYEEAKTKSTLDYCYELYHLDQVQLGEPLSPHCLLYTRPHAVPHPIVCLCTSLAAHFTSNPEVLSHTAACAPASLLPRNQPAPIFCTATRNCTHDFYNAAAHAAVKSAGLPLQVPQQRSVPHAGHRSLYL